MNIGIVTTWFPAGGGYVSKAYKEVLSKAHNVFIYARGGQNMAGDSVWDDKSVSWAPYHTNGVNTSHLIKWAKHNNIDVLFFNEQRYWKPVIEAKKAGFCIGSYIDYYTQETVPAFGLYNFLICNTKRHYSVFNWHKNVHYIPWGTDVNKFAPIKTHNKKVTFIISAGWQGKYSLDRRGTLLAIKAFNNVEGDCKLIVYSQVKFNDCLPEWQGLISVDKRIEFKYGTFDPFPYNEGDVYLYPSRLDGIGLTLPEALASGLAAITTNNPPMNEFVLDGYNGKLVNVEKYLGRRDGYYWAESICNSESLTNAMQFYIKDKNVLLEHKVNARTSALNFLDWRVNAKDLPMIFENELKIYNKGIDKNIENIALGLDKAMSPSIIYKFKSAFYSLYRYFIKI
ncbi:Glycosyl transferases group 1 [Lutibacter agarilyticus]|uniref:Glycosyl transferases group 1 n=1 Tax=Lutibacter agarilyticus TaxID=1109740 RepID=A0A238YUD2_9FLAO|nr:glycosyltransferase family 4 protein [Lutibacter agarilyticus]SNR74755.1 Glycosyl transferases group 1 [Lutibacter agarilyticus]